MMDWASIYPISRKDASIVAGKNGREIAPSAEQGRYFGAFFFQLPLADINDKIIKTTFREFTRKLEQGKCRMGSDV